MRPLHLFTFVPGTHGRTRGHRDGSGQTTAGDAFKFAFTYTHSGIDIHSFAFIHRGAGSVFSSWDFRGVVAPKKKTGTST